MNKIGAPRLHNLDYLRGLAAFSIMIYHYLSWNFGEYESSTFLGRIGLYGVSIFYILSGLTLYFVYYNRMTPSGNEIRDFFKKRIFRIYPLLWLVTLPGIILAYKTVNWYDAFLNLSGLFGFVKWWGYFNTGVWSIGNELVFYAFFPFFVWFTKSYKPIMIVLSVVILSLYLYFTFVKIDQTSTIAAEWKDYINPLNQVFLFLSGFLMGFFFEKRKVNNGVATGTLFIGLCAFTFYPVVGNPVLLVSGINRLVFTACCLMICFSFYKASFGLPKLLHKFLVFLGEASYSLYLLHPIVYLFADKFIANVYLKIGLSMVTSLIVSYVCYNYFERFFIRLGKKKLLPKF